MKEYYDVVADLLEKYWRVALLAAFILGGVSLNMKCSSTASSTPPTAKEVSQIPYGYIAGNPVWMFEDQSAGVRCYIGSTSGYRTALSCVKVK